MKEEEINLWGFQSTSTDKDKAIGFATDITLKDKKPVLLQIIWKGRRDAFRMNNKKYSAIPTEKEILL